MFAEYEDYSVYLNSCKGYTRTHEQQVALLTDYRVNGNIDARDEFVRAQLVWVAQTLLRHYGKSGHLMDLIQDANLQLLHLAEIYNPSVAKFRTYAEPIILKTAETNRSRYAYSTSGTVNAIKTSKRLRDKWEECIAAGLDNHHALLATTEAYVREVRGIGYAELSASQQQNAIECVRGLLSLTQFNLSLDTPMGDGSDDACTIAAMLGDDKFAPEDMVIDDEEKDMLRKAVATLSARQQFVVIRFFGLFGYTKLRAVEIADALGVSRQRVNTILNGAIRLLRQTMAS